MHRKMKATVANTCRTTLCGDSSGDEIGRSVKVGFFIDAHNETLSVAAMLYG